MIENPFISVLIPTYNRAHLFTDTIDSVLHQSYESFEVFVIDDHSSDNTKEVVESYNDSRVKYIKNKRSKGAQGARNTGIINSSGDFIAFLDSDDEWHKKKLELQLSEMLLDKKEFSYTNRITVRAREKEKSNIKPCSIYKKNYVGTFSTVIISKKLQKKVGYLDESLMSCQDWDYWIRASKYKSPHLINEPLLFFNHNNHERITNSDAASVQGHRKILTKYYNDIKAHGFLAEHYYKLAIITGDMDYLMRALNEKIKPIEISRVLYHKFLN